MRLSEKPHFEGWRLLPTIASLLAVAAQFALGTAQASGDPESVPARQSTLAAASPGPGAFPLAQAGQVTPLCASRQDFPGVLRVLGHFQDDIERVTGLRPRVYLDSLPPARNVVLVGTLGKNGWLDRLVREGRLRVDDIAGKWECSLIQVVEAPFPGVERALVIAGSDKRGTIYGMFEISRQMGVSPWYWWADVPVKRRQEVFLRPERMILGEPKIRYRGIFINDEAPALSGWAYEKFGGFNSKFYEKVFELILRLRGNFLWPAMWGRAFYVDDPENPRLADEYGVVIGTSHHEPMMRAHVEWSWYGKGPWDYQQNAPTLRLFWEEGIRRMGNYESIVTLGMRGDGDYPMSEEANIELLQRIVRDQREILARVTGKNLTDIPQVWALYKEVQEYYDKGMRVPPDVTILYSDDNWGNIRRVPPRDELDRPGGYGMYYHFDYVGAPRNYKWLNTNQISRVWEQMHLAYEYGVHRIWIVNVGDIKPMEFPITFFLDYAWDPEAIHAEDLPEYARKWAEEQFGPDYAAEIAYILTEYTRFNSRRKPELLSPDTYSLVHYREAERIVEDYRQLEKAARALYEKMPAEYRDAFYQLVLHPVEACANLNDLYATVGKNRLYARQGRAATNDLARRARDLFQRDAEITRYYNEVLANGKWNHMMDQTHIGYTSWQQPETNVMPEVRELKLPAVQEMGVAIEGREEWWPQCPEKAVLPVIDKFQRQRYYIEIFNRGSKPFDFRVRASKPWVNVSQTRGRVEKEIRIWVSVDWDRVPAGSHMASLQISGPKGRRVEVEVPVHNPAVPEQEVRGCFVESNGCISIEAEHSARVVNTGSVFWQVIPDLGRTMSGVTPFPVTMPRQTPPGTARLEYDVYLFSSGQVKVVAYLSPTLNFLNTDGLQFAVSFDDEVPQVVNMHAGMTYDDWEERVRNNVVTTSTVHLIQDPGRHVLKIWAVDPGVVLQKIVIDAGGVKPSYLGPPESYRAPLN